MQRDDCTLCLEWEICPFHDPKKPELKEYDLADADVPTVRIPISGPTAIYSPTTIHDTAALRPCRLRLRILRAHVRERRMCRRRAHRLNQDSAMKLSELIRQHSVSPAILTEDQFYTVVECARAHGLEYEYIHTREVDDDVASYAIEMLEAHGE